MLFALVPSPGSAADGLLITGLTPFERDLLDAYEGDEYRRAPIATMLADEPELHEADAYLPVIAVPTDAHEWSLSRWQVEHKPRVLVSELAEAARLRERLKDRQLGLEITPQAEDRMMALGYDPVYGARPMKRLIQSQVETAIARTLIQGRRS